MTAPAEWFRDWFGEAYLSLYPHRNEADAGAGVGLFESAARPEPGAAVLDLGCGVGRHLTHLFEAGHDSVGFDLSARLLAEAKRTLELDVPLVRGDMRRLPFRAAAFGAVVNFFTSFGYFATPEEDRYVVDEVRRVLRPGGVFLLDYLNAPHVRDTLVPSDESESGGRLVRQTRWIDGETVTKRIEIAGPRPGEEEVYYERVRMYEPDQLVAMLRVHGLRTTERFGDYDGSEHGAASSRLLLVGRAE
jgi:SAM-dependent methyltransferase